MKTLARTLPRLLLAAAATARSGGQGLNLFHIVEGLRVGFDVTVYCHTPFPGLPTRLIPPPGVGEFLWSKPLLRRLRDWQTLHYHAHFDKSVSRQLEPAAVFHGASGQCYKSLKTARRLGCRTVLDVVTLHVDDFYAAQIDSCRRFGIRAVTHPWELNRIRQEYRTADLIRVMSHRAARSFLERGFPSDRLVVAQPPFDLEEFQPARFDEPVFRICYVGLLEPWKGFDDLVEAFNQLRLPDSELVLWGGVGSRPVGRYLKERMSANPAIKVCPVQVRQVGYETVYGRSSVLVHPSLADGFGYVVGEALASGLPVVVTSETGASDLVRDGYNGYVIPTRDRTALVDRLSYLARNPALVRRMGENARASMRCHTPAAFSASYTARIRALADESGSGVAG